MTLKITRWSPDTCECVLEYEWDTDDPQETRTHTPVNVVKACPAHSAQETVAQKFNKVNDENTRKNKVLKHALDNIDEIREEILDGGQPTGTYTLKNGTEFNWSFDNDRVLHVSITGLTAQRISQLQTLADNYLGVGKVVVENG